MTSAEQIEVAIRAGQLAKSVLAVTDTRASAVARMVLASAAAQFNDLNKLLAKIEVAERGGK